jgi:hypothetical protein
MYSQSVRLLCNCLHAQFIGNRYALRMFRNTEQVFCDHGRLISYLRQPKILTKHLPATGSLSFPSWSVVNQWNVNFKSERFYSKGKGDKS